MLLRRSLVCREGGGPLVAYRAHISGNPTNQEIGHHCAEGANGSGQLPIGESIQGVCLQEDLSPFVEELATQ